MVLDDKENKEFATCRTERTHDRSHHLPKAVVAPKEALSARRQR